jgi:arachidonate 15-lipoxygenase
MPLSNWTMVAGLGDLLHAKNRAPAVALPLLGPTTARDGRKREPVSPFTRLILPQNDTPEGRAGRRRALDAQQARYRYDHPESLGGLPMATTPIPVEISLDWAADVLRAALGLGANLIDLVLPNALDLDVRIPGHAGPGSSAAPAPEARRGGAVPGGGEPDPVRAAAIAKAVALRDFLSGARAELAQLQAAAVIAAAAPPGPAAAGVLAFLGAPAPPRPDVGAGVVALLHGLFQRIAELLGEQVGVYGRARDLSEYDHQFRTLPLPWPAGVLQSDEVFAQLRVAGANPGVLRRAAADDLQSFALDDATLRRVTGDPEATIAGALAGGALYVADYEALQALAPGEGKYVFAPKALFFVPASGHRALRPVAVQTARAAGSPVFFPGDGKAWEIAKIVVNMADANHHEIVNHLGLTHLLIEPFVLATYRQLDPEHPLHALLSPHFAGTLLINYGAQITLGVAGGPMDRLLSGTIDSSRALWASAVRGTRYNASFFPETLAARGVADADALPDYPYRDDALSLWEAIHAWVEDYVSVYYAGDGDVEADFELQAWVRELAAEGGIQDIGEGAPGAPARIATRAYLATLTTQVIFTASVGHATVHFPHAPILSFAPAMPFAAYAPFPAPPGQPETDVLDVLPPLHQSLFQQAVGYGVGPIQYTVLGQYGGQLAVTQVEDALLAFQRRLQAIERRINAANRRGTRTPYTTLLPSAIPQSINI